MKKATLGDEVAFCLSRSRAEAQAINQRCGMSLLE
jgi:hypothetical protein